jgi:hypothetical protein
MPGYVLNSDTIATCPHGGQVSFTPSQSRVSVDSAPALLVSDLATVAGCAFVIGTVPSPCLTVQWIPATAALRVAVHQTPVLLSTTVGLCLSTASAPQGPVVLSSYQQRVQAQ